MTVQEPPAQPCAIVEGFARTADAPTLHGLSYALRHPETWPEGFVWRYDQCRQCAMGPAIQLWDMQAPKTVRDQTFTTWTSWAARKFAMSYDDAAAVFFELRPVVRRFLVFRKVVDIDQVTPDLVADAIDAYLAAGT